MLSKIDELTRPDHFYLEPSDDCYYLREYTARRPYQFSATNQLIFNLKKTADRRGRPEWVHKERAIRQVALELHESLNPDWLRAALLVPHRLQEREPIRSTTIGWCRWFDRFPESMRASS